MWDIFWGRGWPARLLILVGVAELVLAFLAFPNSTATQTVFVAYVASGSVLLAVGAVLMHLYHVRDRTLGGRP